jgi:cytochrome c oxidase subunit 4
MSAHAHHEHGAHHVSSVQTYVTVFGALLFFTVLTYAVSFANLGPFSLPVAMLVATCKAFLVCTFFMHLKYDERFNLVIFASSLFFVGVFAFFTLVDLGSRDYLVPEESHYFFREQAAAREAEAAAAAAAAAPAEEAPADTAAPAAADPAHGGGH